MSDEERVASVGGEPARPVILFGGKGGVGKTTCSAAAALQLAGTGRRTLLITSDATPSLSDIFEEEIGGSIRAVAERLDAMEIGEAAILERWKGKFGPDFTEILSRLLDVEGLDGESRHQLLDYIGSAPALREETLLDLIAELAASGAHDCVVWDTAPAGETLNLLNMPAAIRAHLRAGSRVFEGLDRIGKRFTGRRSIAQIMDEWIATSERLSRFLLGRAAFILVACPEALVVRQARRVAATLRSYPVALRGLVINRVIADPGSAELRALRDLQEPHLAELAELAGRLPVARLPFSLREIRGRQALREIGEILVAELGLLPERPRSGAG